MARVNERRDLSLLRETGSTVRVLNLIQVHDRFGTLPEYSERPMFYDRRLNQSLIVKHTVRSGERQMFARAPTSATKVILPFDRHDLKLGGAWFFVDQVDMNAVIVELLGVYKDPVQFDADVQMLRMLSSLPAFDPFLMRERLRKSGVQPARCYFDVTDADLARMRAFVSKHMAQLVELAFANQGANARSFAAKLADKLMTDETAQSLEPLRMTLNMDGEEYREGVFAWKGFLYYKWLVGDLAPQLASLARHILSARLLRPSNDERNYVDGMRREIVRHMGRASSQVQSALDEYDRAFADLSAGKPNAFRNFLQRAPALFLVIGEAVGVIKHVESFWRFRFPSSNIPLITVDDAIETFQEFESSLGGIGRNEDELPDKMSI